MNGQIAYMKHILYSIKEGKTRKQGINNKRSGKRPDFEVRPLSKNAQNGKTDRD